MDATAITTRDGDKTDPLLTFLWGLDGLPGFGGFYPPQAYRILRCSLNFRTFDTMPVFNSGSKSYFPGAFDVQPITVTFWESSDNSVLKWIQAWQTKVSSKDGKYGAPRDYKKDLVAKLYDNKGNVKGRYAVDGAWPSSIAPLGFDKTTSDQVLIEVTFSVDSVYPLD